MDCPIHAAARRTPRTPALITPGGALSFAALDTRVGHAAAWLLRQGLHAGDRLALHLWPDEHCHALLFAAFRAGLVACPVDPRFPPAYAAHLIASLGCAAVVAETSGSSTWLGARRLFPAVLRATSEALPPGPLPESAAAAIWTSGSGGAPKAVVLRVGNLIAAARAATARIPLSSGDRWYLSLSPHHVAGLGILFRCAVAGAAVVLPGREVPLAVGLARNGATHLSLVAAQLWRMLDAGSAARLRALKAIVLGGGPLPEALIARAEAENIPVVCSYGMTETCGMICATGPGDTGARLRSAGPPLLPGSVELAVSGEIRVRGDTLFAGYARLGGVDPARDAAGYFATGDLGRFDAAGCLHVVGRLGSRFISGGENVQPEEVEAVLRSLPGILEALVVPVPDAVFGATPVAYLATGGQPLPSIETLRALLGNVLPKYKIPRAVLPWLDSGVGGSLGKPDRLAWARWADKMLAGSTLGAETARSMST